MGRLGFASVTSRSQRQTRSVMDALSARRPASTDAGDDRGARYIAPDCAGQNFYKHPPVLHPRDRFGRDEDFVDYHGSYREMESIAFGDFQFHAMSHRGGCLGLDRPLPAVAKYALQYLFVQAEFGLMCPISVTDTSIHLIRKFAGAELQDYLLPKMLSADPAVQWKGTQFMTERAGGSDVGAIETMARFEGGEWRLFGDKWFCSHADADVALLLARPEGAGAGTAGLALFALPRRLKDGRRNAYRIARLKDKLGTRSMASAEIKLEGAVAYLVGDIKAGLKQMMEQVNLSRLSHGVRAAAMMRRCFNEAMVCAQSRIAFGKTIIEYPLLRRQLLKIAAPVEQSLSMFLFTGHAMDRANAGDERARILLRILTPLLKFRACRDNVPVATGAMEVRGGNGYIEDWVNARLVRDAHVGVLWEGTSNINALDLIQRAVGKAGAHKALAQVAEGRLGVAAGLGLPPVFPERLLLRLRGALRLVEAVAARPAAEADARRAASVLYNAVSAVQLAWEGTREHADPRRLLLARMVLEHRLMATDPLAIPEEAPPRWERDALHLLLDEP
ncbi:MAG: acyl-CoA dehydrogenase family protein, partial [Acetobacteraceae bacterium]|nr:acyl-CoA dehydrogenase family protein [Acetobacteraceae bacterium]